MIDAGHRGVESAKVVKDIAVDLGAGYPDRGQARLLDDAGMVEGQEPRTVRPSGGEVNRVVRGGGAVARPAVRLAHHAAIAVLIGHFLALRRDDKGLGRLDHLTSLWP